MDKLSIQGEQGELFRLDNSIINLHFPRSKHWDRGSGDDLLYSVNWHLSNTLLNSFK